MKKNKVNLRKNRKVQQLIEKFKDKGELITLLLALQRENGFLSREALNQISKEKGIPLSRLYGIATFYSQFSLHPRGRYLIHVCQGTACHVQGAERIAESIKQELGIEKGETTKDKLFTLEYVNCLGCCSLAPVMVVNELGVQAKMTVSRARKIIKQLKGGKK